MRQTSTCDLPPEAARHIDRTCNEFEAALRGGASPRLEDFLAGAEGRTRSALLRELVLLDADYRRVAGQRPTPEEYLARLPELDPAWLAGALGGDDPWKTSIHQVATQGSRFRRFADLAAPEVPGYEVLGELGRGGMGVVWKARHVGLQRLAALKMVLGAADPEVTARFLNEAQAVARLLHANVVQIFEVGECQGRPYLALEFVEGGSLADRLAGTPLPPAEAAGLVETLARAVHYAHERGVVHRDLKPANVLLAADGTPKVTDFGLAKRVDADLGHTRSGAILGTPSYMAPEQALGQTQQVGPAADVWALGAILYEALTGRPPFRAASALETLEQVRTQDPVPPSRLAAKCPSDLEVITLKCLEKEAPRRYASARALADDLGRFLEGRPIAAAPIGSGRRLWRWCRRNPRVAGLLAALFAVLATGLVAVSALWRLAEHRRESAEARGESARRAKALALGAVDRYLTQVSESPRLKSHDLEGLRRELLVTAKEFYEEFVRQQDDDPAVQAERGRAYLRLGEITAAVGNKEEAAALCEQAVEILERLAATSPDDGAYHADRVRAHHEAGKVYRDLNRTEAAERAFRKALTMLSSVEAERPGGTERLYRQAAIHYNLGLLYRDNRRRDEAEQAYQKSRELFERLAPAPDSPVKYQEGLSAAYNGLGLVYRDARRLDRAAEEYRKALAIAERLARAHPTVADYQLSLGLGHNNLGTVYDLSRRLEQAGSHFREAVAVWEKLAEKHPSVTAYQERLSIGHHNLGGLYLRTGRQGQAEASFLRALDVQKQLVAADSKVPRYVVRLGGAYSNLGELKRNSGQPEASLGWFAQAIDTLAAPQKGGGDLLARRYLCMAHAGRADALTALGRRADALRDWDAALRFDDGEDRDLLRMSRAVTLAGQGEHAQATAETGAILAKAAAGKAPALGELLFAAGRVHGAAMTAARQDPQLAPAVRDKLVEQYGAGAVERLAKARAAGFFRNPANLGRLRKDKDLDPLRTRADFLELLAGVQAKPKAKPNPT